MALLKPRFQVPASTIADLEKLLIDAKKKASQSFNSLKKSGQDFKNKASESFDDLKNKANESFDGLKKNSPNALDSVGEEPNKQLALSHARSVSYIMTGKSNTELLERKVGNWVAEIRKEENHKSPRVQSVLGGSFLRMYLDHKVDPTIVTLVRDEIQASPEFKALQAEMQGWLTLQRARFTKPKPSEEKLRNEIARIALLCLRAKIERSGIAFRYELNPVIGGVSKIDVGNVTSTITTTPKDTRIDYRIDVVFFDTYDFDNVRTGEYDAYRKKLAQFLIQGKYSEFWKTYEREVSGALGVNEKERKTHLEQASIFASYMYALEKKGWTPGPLAWNVTVPMVGSLVVPTLTAKR